MSADSLFSPAWAGTEVSVLTSEDALLRYMLQVEAAWGEVLAEAGLAEREDAQALRRIADGPEDVPALAPERLAGAAVGGANPVIPLLGVLRRTLTERGAGDSALHRGATSQDILDSALVLMAHRAGQSILEDTYAAAGSLAELAGEHRDTLCAARSLTKHALPTVFGLRAATWLDGIAAALAELEDALAGLPLQWGGAVGTQAALVDIAGPAEARRLTEELAQRLGVAAAPRPWHVQRQPVLRAASAAAGLLSAFGKAAGDVLTLQRPEIAEVREPSAAGRGGSSAMPHKQNPVLSTLIRSAAIAAPGQLSTLYSAAGAANDERPDGAWHAEWAPLRDVLRLAGGAAARGRELFAGLETDPERMWTNLRTGGDLVVSERLMAALGPEMPGGKEFLRQLVVHSIQDEQNLRDLVKQAFAREGAAAPADLEELFDPAEYLGRSGEFIDSAIQDFKEQYERRNR